MFHLIILIVTCDISSTDKATVQSTTAKKNMLDFVGFNEKVTKYPNHTWHCFGFQISDNTIEREREWAREDGKADTKTLVTTKAHDVEIVGYFHCIPNGRVLK